MSPFIGSSLDRPPKPQSNDPDVWRVYQEELAEQIVSGKDYVNDDLGPQLLAVNIRARGRQHLPVLIGSRGVVKDIDENPFIIRRSYVEGLTPEELYVHAIGARQGLAQISVRWEELSQEARERNGSGAFTVLARARRAKHPGIVFARAAASGEIDPLVDVDSRLLVGLPL
jgi:hypothetical protein